MHPGRRGARGSWPTGLGDPDIVVLDPAREGAGTDVMRALAGHGSTVRTIVYVSCDPASFARDLRVLLDEGWRLAALRAFDIFPMTEHVELVAAHRARWFRRLSRRPRPPVSRRRSEPPNRSRARSRLGTAPR